MIIESCVNQISSVAWPLNFFWMIMVDYFFFWGHFNRACFIYPSDSNTTKSNKVSISLKALIIDLNESGKSLGAKTVTGPKINCANCCLLIDCSGSFTSKQKLKDVWILLQTASWRMGQYKLLMTWLQSRKLGSFTMFTVWFWQDRKVLCVKCLQFSNALKYTLNDLAQFSYLDNVTNTLRVSICTPNCILLNLETGCCYHTHSDILNRYFRYCMHNTNASHLCLRHNWKHAMWNAVCCINVSW